MPYILENVIDFCGQFKNQTRPKIGAYNEQSIYSNWAQYKNELNERAGKLEKKYSTDYEKNTLFRYICSIASAAQYLLNKTGKSAQAKTERHQKFLDTHVKRLIDISNSHFAHAELETPLELLLPSKVKTSFFNRKDSQNSTLLMQPISPTSISPTESRISTITKDRQTVRSFLLTPEFLEIIRYKNFLLQDDRDHSYLCCIDFTVDKGAILEALIRDMQACQSMQDLRICLDAFYAEEGIMDSAYDILNTAQNLTTMFFSCLGAKTTSILKINEVYNKAQTFGRNTVDFMKMSDNKSGYAIY